MPEYKADHSVDIILKLVGETNYIDASGNSITLPSFLDTNAQVIGRIQSIRWDETNELSKIHGYGTNHPYEMRPANYGGVFRTRIYHINYEVFKYALGVIIDETTSNPSLLHQLMSTASPTDLLLKETFLNGQHYVPYTFTIEVINLRKNTKHVLHNVVFTRRVFDGTQGDFQSAEFEGEFTYCLYDVSATS